MVQSVADTEQSKDTIVERAQQLNNGFEITQMVMRHKKQNVPHAIQTRVNVLIATRAGITSELVQRLQLIALKQRKLIAYGVKAFSMLLMMLVLVKVLCLN